MNFPDISNEWTALAGGLLLVPTSNRTVTGTVTDLVGGDGLVAVLESTQHVTGLVFFSRIEAPHIGTELDPKVVRLRCPQLCELKLGVVFPTTFAGFEVTMMLLYPR